MQCSPMHRTALHPTALQHNVAFTLNLFICYNPFLIQYILIALKINPYHCGMLSDCQFKAIVEIGIFL